MIQWIVEYEARPWTTNKERAGNKWERASLTKKWRGDFAKLAKYRNAPKYDWVNIQVDLTLYRGILQDPGACFPSVKAAIDGLVDAGVLEDDSPKYVKSLLFTAPQRGSQNLIRLTLEGPLR